MRKILLRAPMSPFDNFDAASVIKKDLIWYNIGNMLFPYSMWRTLMTDDTDITKLCRVNIDDVDMINEAYDFFVIPLANAFRSTFVVQMQRLTQLITRLKIPCIVTGAGIQMDLEPDLTASFPFDETVKRFCAAVLEKSALIGVRGEFTAAYLKKLGFGENHVTVIGCPSMFSKGGKLPLKEKTALTPQSKLCINTHASVPDEIHAMLDETMQQYSNHYMIVQDLHELKLLYYGLPFSPRVKNVPEQYLSNATHRLYLENRVRSFVNVKSWVDFLERMDFTLGTRIHGNVASILAGTPSFILAPDSRIRELSEYHNIPHLCVDKMSGSFDLREIYENTDFSIVQKGHDVRFAHFLNFLEMNGLNHIYQDGSDGTNCPYDKALERISLRPPIQTLFGVDHKWAAKRITAQYNQFFKREEELLEKIAKLEKKE